MKSNTFNYSLLAVGVAAVMGLSTGAMASITSGSTTNSTTPAINNVATASYNVAGVTQTATSNIVTVNVSETANFILYATNGNSATDDKNENIATIPGATATFNHILINEGNVSDTYNINTTANNDANIETATPTQGYAHPANTDVAFVIRQKGGAALTADQANALQALGQAQSGNLTGGANTTTRNIKLLPGLQAALSYTSLTPTGRTGGDIAVGTLTATSSFITTATTTGTKVPTLVNENQTIVRLPTFSIVKTGASSVDLTATTPQIAYTITVTNANTDYSADATDFVIRDVLPAGLSLPNNATTDVTVSGGAGTPRISTISGRRAIDVPVANLPVGESRTITFTVNVDKAQFTGANSSVTNNVAVYDKFVGAVGTLSDTPTVGTDYDILDNTLTPAPGSETTRVPAAADLSGGTGVDSAATTTFTRRSLTLVKATTRDIAPNTSTTNTDGQVTHVATITNLGQDVEGDTNNPLTLTFTDGTNAAVDPVTTQFFLIYTPPNPDGTPGSTPSAPLAVTPTKSGNVYTINSSVLPGGIAPNGKLEVRYNMASISAVVGSTENTTVRLAAAGTNPPTIPTITDVTNVRGLTLVKSQALDAACNADASAATFVQTAIDNAKPDQCVIYRIQATNTSSAIQTADPAAASGFNITGLTISDLLSNFSAGATYVPNTAASTATNNSSIGAAAVSTSAITATMSSTDVLAPQGVASLTFKVKIKNAR
ncbi:beta strand repeat-containing protein [Psychrobacter immobilis]|uniref:beta strand repeat-containing protein n=1 Tax=Psychrobacter immobilis TaxID=498 RepID=UPI00191871B9|nr:hypothetical protein [Psychrobacter immobilis]